jgi:Cellulose binding domain/GDSL-like Lipase/Acylhydrolase family/Carbohydrate esterase 2 N-terminal
MEDGVPLLQNHLPSNHTHQSLMSWRYGMKARLFACVLSCVLLLIIQNIADARSGSSRLQAGGNGNVDDPNIHYVGRWDTVDSPFVIRGYWPGVYFKVHFTGTSVAIKIQSSVNFYAKVDNADDVLFTDASGTVMLAQFLPPGTHSLRIATQADSDVMRFQGLVLDPGEMTLPAITSPDVIEFVGDSISGGNKSSKIALTSYAWLTGENLNAEHTNIAYTGVCLVDAVPCGFVKGMSRGFFHLQPIPYGSSPDWDFSRYQARIVVINLGTNDQAYGVSDSTFQSTYEIFLQNIRVKYPLANIFVMRPLNGAKAIQALGAVMTRNAAGDSAVHYVDTTGWLTSGDYVDGLHPNDQGHVKIAQQLTSIIQPYMQNPTPTPTPAPPTDTPTNTPVPPTSTPTDTPTPTPTSTPTSTPTNTPSNTPIPPTFTPTSTPTNTPIPPTNTPPPSAFRLQYATAGTVAVANQIKAQFKIFNQSGSSVPLSQFKIRYYFTRDTAQNMTFNCDYAGVGCANVTRSFVPISPALNGADYYLEIGFTTAAGNMAVNGNSGSVTVRFNKNDWSTFNQSDDYSWDPTKTTLADWTKVTLYRNGTLVWGVEPSGVANTPTPTNTMVPPSPTSTRTPTNTPIPATATPTSTGGLKVQYMTLGTAATATQIKPQFKIVNLSGASVPMSQLKIRYYFTIDTASTLVFSCDYAGFGCANLSGSFVAVNPAASGADYYLELTFSSMAGSIAPGLTSGTIMTRFNKANWSNFNQSDDYSFDATKTAFADWNRVTLYRNGVLIWGIEPTGAPAAAPTFNP